MAKYRLKYVVAGSPLSLYSRVQQVQHQKEEGIGKNQEEKVRRKDRKGL